MAVRMNRQRKKTLVAAVLVLLLSPFITSGDTKTDEKPIDGTVGSDPMLVGGTTAVTVITSLRLTEHNHSEADDGRAAKSNLFTDQNVMNFFESFQKNTATKDGCLENPSYWMGANIPKVFKGKKKEHEACNPEATEEVDMCETFSTDPNKSGCTYLTNLLCDAKSLKCKRSIATPDPNGLTALTDLDELGCSKKYQIRTDIPSKFTGQASYREVCSLFPTSDKQKCKQFATTSQRNEENDASIHDRSECVKPTHLYCDPVQLRCLCGHGYDEVRFQFNEMDGKCYIRPTFDFIDSYLCTPGTEPHTMTVGKVAYNFCRCISSTGSFDSEDPNWWKCGRATLPLPNYMILFAIIILTLER